MDPDANLEEQLRLTKFILESDFDQLTENEPARLAELVEALNEWISRGGFLPQKWSKR